MSDEELKMDTAHIMSTTNGRRWLWRVLDEICGLHGASFSVDPILMARGEGRRSVGIHLMLEAQKASPILWAKMLDERCEELLLKSSTTNTQDS